MKPRQQYFHMVLSLFICKNHLNGKQLCTYKNSNTHLQVHGLSKAHVTMGTFVLLVNLPTAESVTLQNVEDAKCFQKLCASVLLLFCHQPNTRFCLRSILTLFRLVHILVHFVFILILLSLVFHLILLWLFKAMVLTYVHLYSSIPLCPFCFINTCT